MNKITLNGREIELCYNVNATVDVAERCDGDVANLTDIMKNSTPAQTLKLVCGILCDLANGAIAVHNVKIAYGLEEGKPKPKFTEDYFLAFTTVKDLDRFAEVIFDTIAKGNEFTVPDNVKTEEKDIDLAEIEAEKNESKKS